MRDLGFSCKSECDCFAPDAFTSFCFLRKESLCFASPFSSYLAKLFYPLAKTLQPLTLPNTGLPVADLLSLVEWLSYWSRNWEI